MPITPNDGYGLESTLGAMVEEVKDALLSEGTAESPAIVRIVRALNRAKNGLASKVTQLDQNRFVRRLDRSVSAGALSVALPSAATGEYDMRTLLGCTEVIAGEESEVPVYDRREPIDPKSLVGYWLYREGGTLYHEDQVNGFATALTIRLRYTAAVPDLSGTDLEAQYTFLPAEFADLLVVRAILDLLPATLKDARSKWKERYEERMNDLAASYGRVVRTTPFHVKQYDQDIGYT